MRVGNYTLSDLLGRGGTSEVYAAQHRFLGDEVAVKLLRPALAGDTRVRDAFVAEAARTRDIAHPNVIRVLDFGHDDASGCCYLVMERITGESLSARLQRVHRIDEAELRPLAAAIADGMQAAHARGIVHRDLKPGNVMMRGEEPTIVDFGIAKSLGASSAVVTERRVGTVAYMAPEQLTDGLITPAVDIWALGVILYEAVTGRMPFENFADGRLPQLFDTPPRAAALAPISAALDHLIARCLERDPAKRPASMAEVARVLRGASDEERITEDVGASLIARAMPTAAKPMATTPGAARRLRWPIIIAAAVGTVAIATLVIAMGRSEPSAAPVIDAGATPSLTLTPMPTETATPDAGVEEREAPEREAPAPKAKVRKNVKKPRTTSQGETLD